MTDLRYAVVRRGSRLVVLREDHPGAESGILFPATEDKGAYERARAFADSCNEEARGKRGTFPKCSDPGETAAEPALTTQEE